MTQPYQPTPGMSAMQASVLSVNGALATVQTQLGQRLQIRRDWMRAKGTDMPQPGETWMITKEFGNTWSFAMLVSASHSPPGPGPAMMVFSNQAARDAMTGVKAGQLAFRLDSGLTDVYNGSSWHGLSRLSVASPAVTASSVALPSQSSGSVVTLTTLVIYDPGWPYQLAFSGVVSLGIPASNGVNLAARDKSSSGANLVAPTSIPVGAPTANMPYPLTGITGTLTGQRTVYVILQCYNGSGGTVTVAGGAGNSFFAEVRPVP